MKESKQKRVEALFQRCVVLPPSEWKRFLAQHCDDPAVRDEVENRLLKDAGTGDRTRRFAPSWATDLDEEPAEPDDALEAVGTAAADEPALHQTTKTATGAAADDSTVAPS